MEDNEVIGETDYLLRSPANASRLLESIKEILVCSKLISNCRMTLVNLMMELQNYLLINQLEYPHDKVS